MKNRTKGKFVNCAKRIVVHKQKNLTSEVRVEKTMTGIKTPDAGFMGQHATPEPLSLPFN